MEPLLSFVIPFYNVEKYIAQCLDSVYQQDIPEEEYEVICVNDASPDHSRDIVLEYQKKHTNLILVEHEVNKKLGAARNTGRKIARGKYIWNVDSDDMIVPNCLGEILKKCETNELDVLVFRHRHLRSEEILDNDKNTWNEMSKPVSGFDFWKSQCLDKPGIICPVWNKIFRKDYLNGYGIFSPEINMGEDVPFSIEAVLLADKVRAINGKYYIHRENPESLARSLRKTPSPQTLYENSFVCGKHIHKTVDRIPREEKDIVKSIRNIEKYTIQEYSSFLDIMTETDISEFRKICKKNLFSNMFVLNVLGRKWTLKYLEFLMFGLKK